METALITITETLPVALEAELELASDFARASKANNVAAIVKHGR